jgi:hypothetical protein
MLKKTNLLILSSVLFLGCSEVDNIINNAINDMVSNKVTTETIMAKERVTIINDVNLQACSIIKYGLADLVNNEYNDVETLVTELGVNCETYAKPADDTDICIEQSLVDWLEEDSHGTITDLEEAEGDKACVIGYNN